MTKIYWENKKNSQNKRHDHLFNFKEIKINIA